LQIVQTIPVSVGIVTIGSEYAYFIENKMDAICSEYLLAVGTVVICSDYAYFS
jgi:hypothetical protein